MSLWLEVSGHAAKQHSVGGPSVVVSAPPEAARSTRSMILTIVALLRACVSHVACSYAPRFNSATVVMPAFVFTERVSNESFRFATVKPILKALLRRYRWLTPCLFNSAVMWTSRQHARVFVRWDRRPLP
jgi:hypothetical protein